MPRNQYLKPPIKMSATMALNAKINQLRAGGEQVYHLGFGESRFPVHPKILAAFRAHAPARSYLPVAGLPELRAAIAAYYRQKFQLEVEAGQVIIGSGSKSLLYAALAALEGDVILPAPTWVSYDTQAYLTGKRVTWAKTGLEDDYCLTPSGLENALSQARQAGQIPTILMLNSPGNPTGVVYPPERLAALAELARAENLLIISDEIYALTTYGPPGYTSMARYYPEGTVVTGGLSKHLSLGGWRFGLAVLPPGPFGAELHAYMAAVASTIWTTVAAPVQYAALVAYSQDPEIEAYIETCTTIHGWVTGHLHQVLQALEVPCVPPAGGFYLYPSFAPWRQALAQKHGVQTSQELAHFLLDEEHLAALPGSEFGADPHDLTLRLATSYLYALTDEAGEALLAAYAQKSLTREQFLQQACPAVITVGEKFKALVASLE